MKRLVIDVSDGLGEKLNSYLEQQTPVPTTDSVIEEALKAFLEVQMWSSLEISAPTEPLDLPIFEGDVDSDASIKHDFYTSLPKRSYEATDR